MQCSAAVAHGNGREEKEGFSENLTSVGNASISNGWGPPFAATGDYPTILGVSNQLTAFGVPPFSGDTVTSGNDQGSANGIIPKMLTSSDPEPTFAQVTDGLSNTVFLIESAGQPQVYRSGVAVGSVIQPTIGVELAPDQWVARLGLKGVLVLNVLSGSPAAKAGIRPTRRLADGRIRLGDLIVALDNTEVASSDDFLDVQQSHRVGDTVMVTLNRDGKREQVQAALVAGH